MGVSGLLKPVGPFDIPLLRKLQSQGVQLDPKRMLTRPQSPLSVALRAPLSLHQPFAYTYLAQLDRPDSSPVGALQLRCRRPDSSEADVTFVAPALDTDPTVSQLWNVLLNEVCWEAGRNGVQRVFASLPADSGAVVPFLNAGFVVFAQEELLRHDLARLSPRSSAISLRLQRDVDVWSLQRLYAAIVPLGVKQAEGVNGLDGTQNRTPASTSGVDRQSYVMEQRGEIVGHVEITRGRVGDWIHFAVHPGAREQMEELVEVGLALLNVGESRPVYTNVRTYESIVKSALVANGFGTYDRRALAVRQTLARVRELALAGVPVLEHTAGASATLPLVRLRRGTHQGQCPRHGFKTGSSEH